MNARPAVVLVASLALYAASAAVPSATAQTPRAHTVRQITLDGKPVDSAYGVTVTPSGGKSENSIRRDEAIADGTRIDVPVRIVVVIASTGDKSTTTLEPGSSVTFITTGRGELVANNGGKTLFSVVPGALDFFHVQSGEALTASVHGTEFSVDASGQTIAYACTSGEVNITKTGYLQIGNNRTQVSLIDAISPAVQPQVAYTPTGAWSLGHFANFNEALSYYQDRLAAARRTNNPNALAVALRNTASVQDLVGKYQAARALYQEAFDLAQQSGDRNGEAGALRGRGLEEWRHSDFADALQSEQQALAIYQELGDLRGEGAALNTLGMVQTSLGQYSDALQSYQASMALARQFNLRSNQVTTYNNIGNLQSLQRQYADALASHQEALRISRETANRTGEAQSLLAIGVATLQLRRIDDAMQPLQDAYKIFNDLAVRDGAGKALLAMGNVRFAQKKYTDALQSYQQAEAIFLDTGDVASASRTMYNIDRVKTIVGR